MLLHWDGKMLLEITGERSVNLVAILVTAMGQEKLLGVPKVPAGTGAEIGHVCIDYLQEHHLSESRGYNMIQQHRTQEFTQVPASKLTKLLRSNFLT